MRIFLVRHGMSQSNLDWKVNQTVADHAIELAEEGHRQALEAGFFLSVYFNNILSKDEKIRLWHSPYMRTRQTAQNIVKNCRKNDALKSWFCDSEKNEPVPHAREHLLLAEQQFGVFDGLSDEERKELFPHEQAYYEKAKQFSGKIWPKLPLGESRFEVCQRVHQSFGTFHRDAQKHNINNIVIVGHGTTNRAFLLMWLHKPYEWFENEPNPKNCSIRLIDDGIDKGYIFAGFPDPENYKHKKE